MSQTRFSRRGFHTLVSLAVALTAATALTQGRQGWRDSFTVDKTNLMDTGTNPYFILEPGYRLRFAHGKDTLTVTVLNETRLVDGVRTRVVEEREIKGGKLDEVSRNYFAIDKSNSDIYYFGEEVDIYKKGQIVDHEGAWLAGENGARFGLMVPNKPRVGDKYYQEIAPKVAMDRVEIVSITEALTVPAGKFNNCLHTRESSDLERGSEGKWYAPGVGLIRDDDYVLVGVDKEKR